MADDKTDIAKVAAIVFTALALASCQEPPKICHDGYLYTDVDEDGIYTGSSEGWTAVECVERRKNRNPND